MSEDREYGLEDGYADGQRSSTPNPTNGGEVERDSEYAIAYLEGYDQALADLGLVKPAHA